jgi:hypothetical protein
LRIDVEDEVGKGEEDEEWEGEDEGWVDGNRSALPALWAERAVWLSIV